MVKGNGEDKTVRTCPLCGGAILPGVAEGLEMSSDPSCAEVKIHRLCLEQRMQGGTGGQGKDGR